MKYYKIIEDGKITAVYKTKGTIQGATEITEAEYNQLLAEIRARAEKVNEYVALIQDEQLELEEVHAEYREEVGQILESLVPVEEPNQYGIPQEVLEQIQEDTILELIEMGVM